MSEAPRKKATLWDMAQAAGREAERIRFTQAALVKGGMRDKPHAGEIRKAEIFEDIERLLITIEPVKDEVRRVIAPVAREMANTEKIERDREKALLAAPQEQEQQGTD